MLIDMNILLFTYYLCILLFMAMLPFHIPGFVSSEKKLLCTFPHVSLALRYLPEVDLLHICVASITSLAN